jgi:hypothetical protein
VDDGQRRTIGDGQRRRRQWSCETAGDKSGLPPTGRRKRRLGLALEAALDDQLRLAVADEH